MHTLCIAVCSLLLLAVCTHGLSLSWVSTNKVVESRDPHVRTPRSVGTYYDLRRGRKAPQTTWLSRLRRDSHMENPSIISLNVEAMITDRFSETFVTSIIHNPTDENKQAKFDLQIPEKAFISNFTMIIDGELMIAEVKSKEDAEEMYKEAQENNKTAGKVSSEEDEYDYSQPEDGMEKFTVAVTIKAKSSVEFELTYLQLLERYNKMYEQGISLRPNQIVEDFEVDVYIYDRQGVKDISTYMATSDNDELVTVSEISSTLHHISFHPTVEQQRQMDAEKGVNQDLIISFEVNHEDNAGLLLVESDKYFAHYFSPKEDDYTPLNKNIIFVIDISGSMSGDKMDATRAAMQTILSQLRSGDMFMMILFDDILEFWPKSGRLVEATTLTINDAKTYADRYLKADGGTNIDEGVNTACRILRDMGNPLGSSLVMFLTDGEPTVGETNPSLIVSNVVDSCANQVVIFSLAFGYYVDMDLLMSLADRTGGGWLRIYESETSTRQLQEFFYSIADPLLYEVEMGYPSNIVDIDSLTNTNFKQWFGGSELVVVGMLVDDLGDNAAVDWEVTVSGKTDEQEVIITSTAQNAETSVEIPDSDVSSPDGFVEKLYVYLRIKDLLRRIRMTDDIEKKNMLEEQALELALEYRLVTPLTSMIIVQSDASMTEDNSAIADMGSVMSKASAHCNSFNIILTVTVMIMGILYQTIQEEL